MSKYLLLITIFLIFSSEFDSSESSRKSYVLNVNRITTSSKRTETEKLVLDKNTVCPPCPPGHRSCSVVKCDDNMAITVSASKPENDKAIYKYTVSGGRIIGEGAKVVWNMTGAQPGTYQIRVDIEGKSKEQKQSETKTITVFSNQCICDCVCPTLSVDPPTSPTEAGEAMTFAANVIGGSGDTITYNWTVSVGEIIEGQGTPVIKVSTNSKMAGKTIKATVEIGGVCEECPKTESASSSVASAKRVKK